MTAADVADLKVMCAYVTGDGEAKGDFHLPHHRASDHAVIWKGVAAAAGAVRGSRGASIPASVLPGVKKHLAKHYAQFDRTAPWEEDVSENAAKDTVDDEVADLDKKLTTLAERAADATKGRTGAPAFRAFLRDTLSKLRGLAKKTKNTPADMSMDEMRESVSAAVREEFGSGLDSYAPWITEMYADSAIVCKDGDYYRVPYAIDDNGSATLGDAVEVEQIWQAKTAAKNKAGTTGKEADMADLKAIATALGLPETADEPAVLKAIAERDAEKAKHGATDTELKDLRTEVTKLRTESSSRAAADQVDDAIDARKLAPAQKDWALAYAAKDPDGFKAYVEKTPELFKAGESGSAGDAPESRSDVAQFQAKVAEKVKADSRDIDPGEKLAAAQRAVASEEPELFAAVYARR